MNRKFAYCDYYGESMLQLTVLSGALDMVGHFNARSPNVFQAMADSDTFCQRILSFAREGALVVAEHPRLGLPKVVQAIARASNETLVTVTGTPRSGTIEIPSAYERNPDQTGRYVSRALSVRKDYRQATDAMLDVAANLKLQSVKLLVIYPEHQPHKDLRLKPFREALTDHPRCSLAASEANTGGKTAVHLVELSAEAFDARSEQELITVLDGESQGMPTVVVPLTYTLMSTMVGCIGKWPSTTFMVGTEYSHDWLNLQRNHADCWPATVAYGPRMLGQVAVAQLERAAAASDFDIEWPDEEVLIDSAVIESERIPKHCTLKGAEQLFFGPCLDRLVQRYEWLSILKDCWFGYDGFDVPQPK